ncbi:MAG: ATP-dependent DNA ligase, partial [Nocardioidaceae bacterium]
MLLTDVVEASNAVAATRSRKAKVEALARALRNAGPSEVETTSAYLSGVLRQRRTGLGWRGLSDLPAPAGTSTLSVAEVNDAFERISAVTGPGSRDARTALVADLFGRATEDEQHFLRRLVTGDLRQGALDGLMLEAIATAADVP